MPKLFEMSPTCCFLSYMENWSSELFWFVTYKVTVALRLKIDKYDFLGEKLALRFLAQKGPGIGPN